MGDSSYDTIVIGGGVMGCAAAYHLAKDSRRVLLLEQFAIGHSRGSSHGRSRIIRLTYALPDYVELARAAYAGWRTLQEEAGETLLVPCGGLEFGPPGTPSLEALRANLSRTNVPFEWLDERTIARRFPQFRLPEGMAGLYQAETSILDADRCVAALAALARSRGAALREGEAALRLAPDGRGVLVETARDSYWAERLVIAAGSWAHPLLRQLGLDLPLTVTREQFAYFAAGDPERFQPGRFPIFVHHDAGDGAGYGFPIYGLPGVKVARPRAGPAIEPDEEDRDVDAAALATLRAYARDLLPGLDGDVAHAQTCRYTTTPDTHFVVDRHPAHPQVVVASPCSGHGFKFGVLIGRIAADLAWHGATDHPIDLFRIDRLRRKEVSTARE